MRLVREEQALPEAAPQRRLQLGEAPSVDALVTGGEAGEALVIGAVARVGDDATAFPHRQASHDINIVASWLPDQVAEADRHIGWVREFFAALQPYSRGVYVNFTSDDPAERIRQAYTQAQWARLTALKAKYDPTNFFRLNANIPPSR
jgi:hypothetical protein